MTRTDPWAAHLSIFWLCVVVTVATGHLNQTCVDHETRAFMEKANLQMEKVLAAQRTFRAAVTYHNATERPGFLRVTL